MSGKKATDGPCKGMLNKLIEKTTYTVGVAEYFLWGGVGGCVC